ncbi:hypothetical protein [Paludibacterium purpuratum]|uniref:Prohead serine protease n=1 Tax=Paludibacterium purpuratum TaxID=1144873 RepID=A0A4V3DVV2_9NEIS|nr:hypothetical protein [Paludibacterium purpuratum]TDR82199.1 hypothetical protein DFP86_102313 [Paludibacterium purpuratum]
MKFKQFATISKVEEHDDGTVTVEGIASDGSTDLAGEIVAPDAMKAALPDFMRLGTGALREMHQPMAAGRVDDAYVNDAGETIIRALVVDPVAVLKVKQEVYKGFSIGGKSTLREANVIKGLKLTEISLVDAPCNTNAVFQVWKADGLEDNQMEAQEELALMIQKGDITHEALLELAKAKKPKDDDQSTAADDKAGSTDQTGNDSNDGQDGNGDGAKGGDQNVDEKNKDKAAKSAPEGDVAKGMWTLQDFAAVLQSLSWIVGDAQYEAQAEGDSSQIPAQLRDWVAQGAKIFTDMAAEEAGELAANLQTLVPPPVVVAVDDVALADAGGDVAKAGAKFSTDTKTVLDKATASIQAALDALKSLGHNDDAADNQAADDGKSTDKAVVAGDVAKASAGTDIAKLADDLSKALAANADLAKRFDTLSAQHDDLQKRFDAQPAPMKGVAMAVSKGEDINGTHTAEAVEPVRKADGTVDDFATEIKKAQQSNAFQVFR